MSAEVELSLEEFVIRFKLPQRAKVLEGYYEQGDVDSNREFSRDDVLDVKKVICPFVALAFRDKVTGKDRRLTVATNNTNLWFEIVSEKKPCGSPVVFKNVMELVKSWPTVVKALSEHPGETPAYKNGEWLSLIRVIYPLGDEVRTLEVKRVKTLELVQLPLDMQGSFIEVLDENAYTLQELVDIAKVPRLLKISRKNKNESWIPGIPAKFDGYLRMEKPDLLAEVCRVLQDDDEVNEEERKISVPVDSDIKLAVRDEDYSLSDRVTCVTLNSLVELFPRKRHLVYSVTEWNEQTTILQNHFTRPGDKIVIYEMENVTKILASHDGRHFAIPSNHQGCFKRIQPSGRRFDFALSDLNSSSKFPFDVEYGKCSAAYSNLTDDLLPAGVPLQFNKVETEPCFVVSKIFSNSNALGPRFHLPVRTNIRVRFESKMNATKQKLPSISVSDWFSEEMIDNTLMAHRLDKG